MVLVLAALGATEVRASVEPQDVVVVQWAESECLSMVDRSAGTDAISFDYEILAESPMQGEQKGPEEAEESRTIQFIAFCEDPWYPSASRVYAADDGAAGLPPSAVLETSGACWTEITDAAGRRPMLFEANEEPVIWDIAAVPPGAYTIWSFSLAPPFFVWVRRQSSVVKIHDGDPDAVGPALAITSGEMVLSVGDLADVEGCIDAMPGTTLRGEFKGSADEDWTVFVDDVEAAGSTFALSFAPPGSMGSIDVRVVATDALGRSFTAYAPYAVLVIDAETPCEEGASFVGCPPGGGSSTGAGSTTDTGDTEGLGADDPSTGGCRVGGHGPWWLLFALVGVLGRRRASRG